MVCCLLRDTDRVGRQLQLLTAAAAIIIISIIIIIINRRVFVVVIYHRYPRSSQQSVPSTTYQDRRITGGYKQFSSTTINRHCCTKTWCTLVKNKRQKKKQFVLIETLVLARTCDIKRVHRREEIAVHQYLVHPYSNLIMITTFVRKTKIKTGRSRYDCDIL